MALGATGSFMLGEVTARKCFYQAKVFHELNLRKIELLQDVFLRFVFVHSSIPHVCRPHSRPPDLETLHGPQTWVRHGLIFFDLPKLRLQMARIGNDGSACQPQCAILAVQPRPEPAHEAQRALGQKPHPQLTFPTRTRAEGEPNPTPSQTINKFGFFGSIRGVL